MNITAPILTTLTAALVAAAPAAASVAADLPKPSDPRYAVPAGKVEHSVTLTQVSGSNAVPSHTRHELWLSRNRARSVITDIGTGRVTAETVITPDEVRTYSAKTRQVTVRRTSRASLPYNSSRFEAAVQRAYVEQGITKVIGDVTIHGRRALVVESVPGRWSGDRPDGRTVAIVDAESYELYERTSTLPGGEFTQRERIRTRMLKGGSAHVRLTMSRHEGAKVRRVDG